LTSPTTGGSDSSIRRERGLDGRRGADVGRDGLDPVEAGTDEFLRELVHAGLVDVDQGEGPPRPCEPPGQDAPDAAGRADTGHHGGALGGKRLDLGHV